LPPVNGRLKVDHPPLPGRPGDSGHCGSWQLFWLQQRLPPVKGSSAVGRIVNITVLPLAIGISGLIKERLDGVETTTDMNTTNQQMRRFQLYLATELSQRPR